MPARPSLAPLLLTALATACRGGGGTSSSTARIDVSGCTSGYVAITNDGGSLKYDAADAGGGPGLAHSCPDGLFPYCVLPKTLPPRLGQAWTDTGTSNGYEIGTSTAVASMTETVTVPGGSFHGCVKYVMTYSYPGGYSPGQARWSTCELWLAEGVGPVKYRTTWDDASSEVGELVAYDATGAAGDYLPLQAGNTWSFKTTVGAGVATWTVASH